jgi:membrane-associated phospholipid phosphatase
MKPQNNILFWQPTIDFLDLIQSLPNGPFWIVILNYSIWFFLFFISYLLVKHHPNIFWQILLAVILGEVVERTLKRFNWWCRPMYQKRRRVPPGLVEGWYRTGSFPSGHSIKAAFFFLFILQYAVFNPIVFLLIVLPLLLFRVLAGFHYPIDMIGGIIIGLVCWGLFSGLNFPPVLVNLVDFIFKLVFFINP